MERRLIAALRLLNHVYKPAKSQNNCLAIACQLLAYRLAIFIPFRTPWGLPIILNLQATKRFNHKEHKGKEAVLPSAFGAVERLCTDEDCLILFNRRYAAV